MAQMNYKANYEDTEEISFDAVPSGDYMVIVENSDFLQTKAGTGRYLKLVYQIINGEYKGKKLFENLNLENPNEQAVQISTRSLNAILKAIDLQTIEDSSELHDIPLMVQVGIKKNNEYGEQNVIKKHYSAASNNANQPTQKPKSNEATEKNQPWKK